MYRFKKDFKPGKVAHACLATWEVEIGRIIA
jgi:hypothetical protein